MCGGWWLVKNLNHFNDNSQSYIVDHGYKGKIKIKQ